MTKASLILLRKCNFRIKCVLGNIACSKCLVILSTEVIINSQCAWICQIQNVLLEEQTELFFLTCIQGVYVFRYSKTNASCCWRCFLTWQMLLQLRKIRISWCSCYFSEIHLWLWKIWSLAAFSQSLYYVTGARKDNKNNWNQLIFARKDESRLRSGRALRLAAK